MGGCVSAWSAGVMPFTDKITYNALGFTVSFPVQADDTDDRYVLVDYRMPPGFGGPALHRHPTHESIYVLEGAVGVHLDGSERTLGPGEAAHIAANEPHSFWNAGHGVAHCLFVGDRRLEEMLTEICETAQRGELTPDNVVAGVARIEARHDVESLGPPPGICHMQAS